MPDFSSVEKLDLSGKRVVVAGGTQGIGAAIARLAAQRGATVAIIGRNATLGNAVLKSFRPSPGSSSGSAPRDHLFIAADLAPIRGAKQAAHRVKEWAGAESVDLLFQTQGGPPSATEHLTEDGLEFHFAIQDLSRFVLPYTLAELGVLKDSTVLSVANAGRGADTVDMDNLDAKGLPTFVKGSSSAAIIDAFTTEFNNRYPTLRVLHSYPGPVRTNVMTNSNSVWYLRVPVNLIFSLPFTGPLGIRTADEYARVALWIAASDEAKKTGIVMWTRLGTEAGVSGVAKDEGVRVQIWEKLVGLTGDVLGSAARP